MGTSIAISKIIEWEVIIGEIDSTRWIGAWVGAGNLNWVAKWFKIDGVGLLERTGRKAEGGKGKREGKQRGEKNSRLACVSASTNAHHGQRSGYLPHQVRLFLVGSPKLTLEHARVFKRLSR